MEYLWLNCNGETKGPYTQAQVVEIFHQRMGTDLEDVLVSDGGDWLPILKFLHRAGVVPPPPPAPRVDTPVVPVIAAGPPEKHFKTPASEPQLKPDLGPPTPKPPPGDPFYILRGDDGKFWGPLRYSEIVRDPLFGDQKIRTMRVKRMGEDTWEPILGHPDFQDLPKLQPKKGDLREKDGPLYWIRVGEGESSGPIGGNEIMNLPSFRDQETRLTMSVRRVGEDSWRRLYGHPDFQEVKAWRPPSAETANNRESRPDQTVQRIANRIEGKHVPIAGWLLVFCIWVALLRPAYFVFVLLTFGSQIPPASLVNSGFISAFGVFVALNIFQRDSNALTWARAYLLVHPIVLGIPYFLISDVHGASQSTGAGIGFSVLWWLYFSRSKHVNEILGKNAE